MRLLGRSRRLLRLKGSGLSPSPQQLHGQIRLPPLLTLVLIWFPCELIWLTQATRGKKKFRFSLGFGNWISLPRGHGTVSAVSCSGRGEYGFASSTDNQLFDHFSYLTWLHPKIRHWDKTKGPFFKWKCSCTHCLNIRFPTCVTLLQYRGADGLCWREDRVFSPVIQNASFLPF